MEYERLTSENWKKDKHTKAYERLAELEDKIENGTLVDVSKKNGIQWSGITEIQVLIDRYTKVKDDDYKQHSVNNNTVFLIKAKAEAKLRELKGATNDTSTN